MDNRLQAIQDLQFLARRYDEVPILNNIVQQESLDYALKVILEDVPRLETERNALFSQNIILFEQNGKLKEGINKCYDMLHS